MEGLSRYSNGYLMLNMMILFAVRLLCGSINYSLVLFSVSMCDFYSIEISLALMPLLL